MHRPQDIEKVLRKFPIGDVWSVGRRWKSYWRAWALNRLGLHQLPPEWVRKRMTVVGLRMWKELRGEPCIVFEQMPAAKKLIATPRSFDHYIRDY